MGLLKPFCALAIYCFIQIIHDVKPMTMDELIQNAAQSSDQFEFLDEKNGFVQVELDMKFPLDTYQELLKMNASKSNGREKRKALRDTRSRWPDAIIPIEIPTNGVFSARDMVQINAALDDWRTFTCINFRQSNTERSRVRFQDGGGCSSFVGRIGRVQSLTLARGCRQKGIIIHEIGHAVGFHHEQTRPDRDRFVRILRENIPDNVFSNFQKYSTSVVNTFDLPYDYNSVMHYGGTAFSTNGRRTIQTLDSRFQNAIGNRQGHSFLDVKLANLMYDCAGKNNCPAKNCPDDGFVGKDCQCWCRGSPVKLCDGGEIGGGGTGEATTTPAPVTDAPENACVDMNSNCPAWSGRGECTRNPGYMLLFCKKSCNVCDEDMTCVDLNTNCDYWKSEGYCTQMYVNYMRTNCPRACNACAADEIPESSNGSSRKTSSMSLVAMVVALVCSLRM